jgi:hypothetical protein
MSFMTIVPRLLLVFATLLLPAWQDVRLPNGMERVQFESARYQVGPLQLRLARARRNGPARRQPRHANP